MLVNELLGQNTNALDMSKQALEDMDWAYDMDLLNEVRFDKGRKQLSLIKNQLAKLPIDEAAELWNEYCPWAAQEPIHVLLKTGNK